MPVTANEAVRVKATGETHYIPNQTPPNINTTYFPRHDVDLSLTVDDARLRDQFEGFDGLEKPFVWLPSERDGAVTWWRHELKYAGQGREGYNLERKVDRYEMDEVLNVDRAAVEKYGVVVGLSTNVGTIWAQQPDDNFKVDWR